MPARLTRFLPLAAAIALDVAFCTRPDEPKMGDFGGFSAQEFNAAVLAQERHNQDLLALPGVAGTAVSGGLGFGTPVIVVYLTVPGVLGIPANLDGHPVITQVTGPFRALDYLPEPDDEIPNPRKAFPRPVPIGVSAGQPDVTAGTIGARVVSGAEVFALSNNHVFANKNLARLGDAILQPGTADGGANPNDRIGTLHDFEPIKFCTPFPICPENRIDAAVAATTRDDLGASTPSNGYGMPRSKTVAARLGMSVQKYGRTTGHTTGRVTGLNATINVGFRDGTARFAGQIVIDRTGFSGPGDSGSLIVSAESGRDVRRPVGLLFAGSETSTLANPIDLVLDRFGVTIDGN